MTALVQRQPSAAVPETDTDSASTITRKDRRDSVSSSIAPLSTAESGSESGYKSEEKTPTTSLHKAPPPSRVFGRRPTASGEGASSRSMTVETETVSSVPQVGLGTINPPGGASIRSKKSTDTIRAPRREKKRLAKKPVTAGPSNRKSELASRCLWLTLFQHRAKPTYLPQRLPRLSTMRIRPIRMKHLSTSRTRPTHPTTRISSARRADSTPGHPARHPSDPIPAPRDCL